MEKLNLKKVSELLSDKLKRNIEIVEVKPIGSGYHSNGFMLIAKNNDAFFIKKIKSNDLGFELPERKIYSLLKSNEMSKRSENNPAGIGIMVKNRDEEFLLPDINEDTEIYHLQNIIPGREADSKNYWELLQERKQKPKIDDEDLDELEKITDVIANIHRGRHLSDDAEYLKRVYSDGLRSILTNPELTFTFLAHYSDDNEILPRRQHSDYVSLMLKNVYKWENRSDRLRSLHGDFWGTNLFFTKTGTYLIDFSRIPWGDPGIDIGFWIAQYLWFYHETGNLYFKNLIEEFFKLYIKKTGDEEIKETVSLVLGLMGVVYTNPKLYPDLDNDIAKRFMDNIWRILKEQKFIY